MSSNFENISKYLYNSLITLQITISFLMLNMSATVLFQIFTLVWLDEIIVHRT